MTNEIKPATAEFDVFDVVARHNGFEAGYYVYLPIGSKVTYNDATYCSGEKFDDYVEATVVAVDKMGNHTVIIDEGVGSRRMAGAIFIDSDRINGALPCDLGDVITAKEAESICGVKADTVRDAAQSGRIRARKAGATWLMLRRDAEALWGQTHS